MSKFNSFEISTQSAQKSESKNILNLTVSVLWILDVMLCVSFVVLDKQSGSVHTELLAITIALAMQKMGRISIVSDDR